MRDFKMLFAAAAFGALVASPFQSETKIAPEATPPASKVAAPAADGLDATLWLQRSDEKRALCRQVWRAATERLEEALLDENWTAALEQGPFASTLPPAVIVDVDETVLDNAPYQARLIKAGETYATESWNAWCEEAIAKPVPGALAFARRADALGIEIFYVTNRNARLEAATRNNLERWGFPVRREFDTVFMSAEKEAWTSDKTTRRQAVAKTHRILFLIGDDFNDFVGGVRRDAEVRAAVFSEHAHRFGMSWFCLPNPTYGSWMRAFTRGAKDERAAKRAALQTK